jgi:hypothetical protein
MKVIPANSKEGLANASLRWIELWLRLNPPTLEGIIDQLLAHPDFSFEHLNKVLSDRYDQPG